MSPFQVLIHPVRLVAQGHLHKRDIDSALQVRIVRFLLHL